MAHFFAKQELEKTALSEEELQSLVESISFNYFKKKFLHRVYFNPRLRTTGGRYHLASHNIDFNPRVLEKYGMDELIKVIKHELCHYHLHLEGKGYQHRDQEFKNLLNATGGTRYVRPLMDENKQDFHQYQCIQCQTMILRKRRIDTKKYVCGKCHGKLMETEKRLK